MTKNNDKKVIELEDLIRETEQKILNNEFYEDCEVPYRDAIVKVRIQPITQQELVKITNKYGNKNGGAEVNSQILQQCILNKHDNKRFTLEQINKLFTGGLAAKLTAKCLEVSGIPLNKKMYNDLINF